MRQAGTIPSKPDSQRFVSYLLTLGINAKAEPAGAQWAIWVRDENEVPRSKHELEQFLAEPAHGRYQAAEVEAERVRREALKRTRAAQKNYVDMRQQWSHPSRRRLVTLLLIGASVVATISTRLGQADNVEYFLISTHRFVAPQLADRPAWLVQLTANSPAGQWSLDQIASGQLWRLVTPIFIHLSWLHLLFNMMWMFDLGSMIELQLRPWRYLLLVLVIAVISNLGQFVAGGPSFGGMSGVVYGLLGYAWVRSRMDPTCGLFIHPNTMFFMIGWFVVCLVGLIPELHVANAAHGVGLAVGAALGTLPTFIKRLRRR